MPDAADTALLRLCGQTASRATVGPFTTLFLISGDGSLFRVLNTALPAAGTRHPPFTRWILPEPILRDLLPAVARTPTHPQGETAARTLGVRWCEGSAAQLRELGVNKRVVASGVGEDERWRERR